MYGLQENICQAQENFMERSTSLQALRDENQLMKIKPHFSDNSKLNERNTCLKTSDYQETKVSDRISVQEQLNVVKKISTWKQMPYEGIPKVFPGGPKPKYDETCRTPCWETIECKGTKDFERINVQEQLNTVKEMSTWKQMPSEGLPKVDRSLCYDFDLPGVPLYLRNTCWKTNDCQS